MVPPDTLTLNQLHAFVLLPLPDMSTFLMVTHPNPIGLLGQVESALLQKAFLATLPTLNPDRTHLNHSVWHVIKD